MSHRFPPGPPAPRNILQTVQYFREISEDTIAFVGRRFDAYGDIYYAPIRGQHLFVTRHPEHFEEVLLTKAKHFEKTSKGLAAQRLRDLLGNGLVNSEGEMWRRHRRMINPALSRTTIHTYAATMVDFTRERLGGWRAGHTIDVHKEMTELTLRIVTKVLFDSDSRAYADTVQNAMTSLRGMNGLGALMPKWAPLPSNRRFYGAIAAVDDIIFSMIEDRRRLSADELAARTDLLSCLLRATDEDGDDAALTPQELRDELLTLFFAGHETTSNGLVWTFHLLSENPDVLAWVLEELAELGDERLVAEDVERLPRTRAAFEEAMRLYPPVCVFSRTASDDVTLGDYLVPEGSEVLLWFYWAHHDPRWFPEPHSYLPERFLEPDRSIPKLAFMPFGAGQRTCIGKHFAMMEAVLILATILRERQLLRNGDRVVPELSVTLAPKGGLRMRVA